MPNARILVVEDDETVRQLLVRYLRLHGAIDVDGARDGVEALHRIATQSYAVMILDLMMPKMSGVDLLDSLEALTSDPSVKTLDHTPAVLVVTSFASSALPDDAIVQRYPRMVHGVFRKPLDIQKLGATVDSYLSM